MTRQHPATSLGSGAFGRGGSSPPSRTTTNPRPAADGRGGPPTRRRPLRSVRPTLGRRGLWMAAQLRSSTPPRTPARSRCPRPPCVHRWFPGAGLSEASHVRSPERTSVAGRSEAARQSAMARTTPKLSPTDEPWDDGHTAAFPRVSRVTVRRLRRKQQLPRGSARVHRRGPTGVPRRRILITRRAGGRRRPRRESASGLAGPRDRRCPARRSRQWHRRSQQSRR
jgi:hypothetical protein